MAIFKIIDSFGKNSRAITDLAKYILRDEAVVPESIEITGYFPYDEITPENITKSFLHDKRKWNKIDGRQYVHADLSFHPDERPSNFELNEVAEAICNKVFYGRQVCYAIHNNTDHIHIHFMANSVSYRDGIKFHTTDKDLKRYHKQVAKILKEHNLHVPEKGKDFYGNDLDPNTVIAWNKNKYHTLKKAPLAKATPATEIDMVRLVLALLDALLYARSISDFIERMKRNMWKTTWSKSREHITFESMETGRKFRAANVGKTYGSKFKYVFGKDFELDKEHMEKLLKVPQKDRDRYFDAAYQELIKDIEKWTPDKTAPDPKKPEKAKDPKSKTQPKKKDQPKENFKDWEPPDR